MKVPPIVEGGREGDIGGGDGGRNINVMASIASIMAGLEPPSRGQVLRYKCIDVGACATG